MPGIRQYSSALCAAMAAALPGLAIAGEWDISAEVSAETRYFLDDALLPGQLDKFQFSGTLQPDIRWASDNGKHELVFIPFVRVDAEDDRRSHADLREGYYRYVSDGDWSLLAGVAKVFWGTTESRHLVDIINQTDAIEDVDEEDKLGQPMVMLSYLKDWGQLDLFILPYFRDRSFPGEEGRLRTPLVVDRERVFFSDQEKRDVVDYAARYANFIGDFDIGVSFFNGVSREPRLIAPAIPTSSPRLFQLYDRISQVGLDLQYTNDAWLWKFEGIAREGQGETFCRGVTADRCATIPGTRSGQFPVLHLCGYQSRQWRGLCAGRDAGTDTRICTFRRVDQ